MSNLDVVFSGVGCCFLHQAKFINELNRHHSAEIFLHFSTVVFTFTGKFEMISVCQNDIKKDYNDIFYRKHTLTYSDPKDQFLSCVWCTFQPLQMPSHPSSLISLSIAF